MRIDRVCAHAFGPFQDEELSFAPGMTVVYGPNESGKSSWHAAVYGGLCGLRHVGGRPRTEDRLFEEHHRPWDGDGDDWHASVYVTLDDGRRIHFHGDLDGREDYAVEVDSGRDVVSELDLENDNAPDGAKLLGLTRRTILATIQVRQADVLHVLEAPGGLQEHLQQAAATGGDVTAERAIEHLDAFRSEHVGTMAWNSKRPLKAAHDRVERLESELAAVRRAHEEYVDLHTRLDGTREQAERLERRVRAGEAIRTRRELAEVEAEYDRAAELAAGLPDERPDPLEDDERLEAVTDALAAWNHRPNEPPRPDGPPIEELEAEIAGLPPPPDGATRPAPEVEDAAAALAEARRRLAYHDDSEPAAPEPTLAHPEPEPEPIPGWPRSRLGLVGGSVAAILGIVALAAGAIAAGVVLLAGGMAAIVAGLVWAREARGDPGIRERRLAERERATWKHRRRRLEEEVDQREEVLWSALAGRGVDGADDRGRAVDEALAAYRQACRERAEQAETAARRDRLEDRLAARRRAEEAVERARGRREQVGAQVREAAQRVGVSGDDPQDLADGLRRWRASVRAEQQRRAEVRDAWTELRTLLDGRTLEGLEARIEQRRAALPPVPDGITPAEAEGCADDLDELRDEAAHAREEVARLEGRIQDKEGDLDSVAEAEERLALARDELERVRRLDETLELTRGFLDAARERVQHQVAPLLQGAVEAHLPRITGGRYAHVRVDPDTLEVRVSPDGTRWRRADRLSRGTAEQIYLLLRLAMAEHAVTTDEVAPLILDDVTVQSDRTRTERLLRLLQELSRERQVILFTQEPHVHGWAREHLEDTDRLVELDPASIPA